MRRLFLVLGIFLIGQNIFAQEVSKSKIKYKKGDRIDFESLLIEGERKKPELSVVTGNIGEKDEGLLKMRKDFNDMMAQDFEEVIQ